MRQHGPLKKFLRECKSLTKLELIAVDCDLMSFFTSTEFPFTLRQLTLSSTVRPKDDQSPNEEFALKFFNRNCSTIQTLDLQAPLPSKVLQFALKRFRVLRYLVLRLNFLPEDPNFFFQKLGKKSVKLLTLEGPYLNVNQTKAIFKLYPAIQVNFAHKIKRPN